MLSGSYELNSHVQLRRTLACVNWSHEAWFRFPTHPYLWWTKCHWNRFLSKYLISPARIITPFVSCSSLSSCYSFQMKGKPYKLAIQWSNFGKKFYISGFNKRKSRIISIVTPTRCPSVSNLFYFGMTPYMFRMVFPSIIRSSRLYVQSWTPDDEWKDRPKYVECHSEIK